MGGKTRTVINRLMSQPLFAILKCNHVTAQRIFVFVIFSNKELKTKKKKQY